MIHNYTQLVELVDKNKIVKVVQGYPESEKPFAMEFPIKILYETHNAPKVPLYIHVVGQKPAMQPANGLTGYHYTLSLKNSKGVYIFKDITSTKGGSPLVRIKVDVDPKERYILCVTSTPQAKQKHVTWRNWIYLPYFTLYVGPYTTGTKIDVTL